MRSPRRPVITRPATGSSTGHHGWQPRTGSARSPPANQNPRSRFCDPGRKGFLSAGRVGENHKCQGRQDRPVLVFRQDPTAGRQRPSLDSARRDPVPGLAISNPELHHRARESAPWARESAPSSESHSSWPTTGTAPHPSPESPRCSVLSRAAALLMIFAAAQQSGQLSQNQSVSFGRTSLMVLPQSAANSVPSSR